MKQSVYLTPLFALAAAAGAAELGTMTIQNLPVSAEENRVVCYDSVSGKLGNCPGRETSITVDCNIPGASIKDAIEKATTAAGVALTVNISGTCNETLEIERPNTQLLGDGTATIVGQNTSLGAITVITSPVEMENLVVAGATGPGITVWPGGSLFLTDVTITSDKTALSVFSGKTALSVFSGKAVLIQGNDVSTSGTDKHAMVTR